MLSAGEREPWREGARNVCTASKGVDCGGALALRPECDEEVEAPPGDPAPDGRGTPAAPAALRRDESTIFMRARAAPAHVWDCVEEGGAERGCVRGRALAAALAVFADAVRWNSKCGRSCQPHALDDTDSPAWPPFQVLGRYGDGTGFAARGRSTSVRAGGLCVWWLLVCATVRRPRPLVLSLIRPTVPGQGEEGLFDQDAALGGLALRRTLCVWGGGRVSPVSFPA